MTSVDITATEIITALVAVYGALLSTYIALREWKGRSPNIKVNLSMGFYYLGASVSDAQVSLDASNPGEKAVSLSSLGLILPDKTRVAFMEDESHVTFPYKILPESSCKVWWDARGLAHGLRSMGFSGELKLVGFYGDEVGRTYESKPFEFDTAFGEGG